MVYPSQHSITHFLPPFPIISMFIMGLRKNACLSLAFHIYLFSCCVLLCAMDTVTTSLLIQEPEILRSSNNMYTLGFFCPENSTNRYVGIWLMSQSHVVWVANTNNPLTDSSGILTISDDGNLVVLNGEKQVVWSTNVSDVASNSSAQLLDSGNLVLVNRTTGAFVWQSFQHPGNTLVQGMKLSTNPNTGERVNITSWKSSSDLSHGEFNCTLESRNVIEVFVWKGNHPYWRTGPWDGTDFLGIPGMVSSVFQEGFNMKVEEGSFALSFDFPDMVTSFTLDHEGNIQQWNWDSETNTWSRTWMSLNSECDVYGKCGPFGICNLEGSPICNCLRGFKPKNKEEWEMRNWTNGCVRREVLQCEKDGNGSKASKTDGFLKLERVKLPDNAELLYSDYVNNAIDCQTLCLRNCSCKAYAQDRSLNCLIWNVDLVDVQCFPDRGVDLYIRLAYSEIGTGRRKKTTPILISVLIGTVLITASGYFLWRKGLKQKGVMHMQIHNRRRITNLKQVKLQELSLFDFRQLATATNNFDLANKLGQGDFGPVYKGKLGDGQEIAVKRLSRSSGQGMEEFINEVELISKLQHRNLVRLLGCSIEGEEEILVYEYMPNKSLDTYIFGKSNQVTRDHVEYQILPPSTIIMWELSRASSYEHLLPSLFIKQYFADPLQQKSLHWGKRFTIIEGIARGLLYLHRDSRLRIIHRDLKASNILLDEEMNPKISDFGMAKLFGGSENQANTERIVGTYGYISPEYATEGLYSEKSDVFSFGVLLLEIISGRKNTSFYEDAESFTLLGFAWKLWVDGNVMPLIDRQIYDPSFHKDILQCIHIGLLCVQELAKDRPTMASVMSILHSEIMDIPPPNQPAFILRQTMSHAAEQTPNNDELCSINTVTISHFEGR